MLLGDAELTNNEKSYIHRFKDKAREFWTLWNNLNNQQSIVNRQSSEIKQEYNDLISRGTTIRSTVEYVTRGLDRAANMYQGIKDWFSSTFGMGENEIDNRVDNLGIIPLIPIAIIIASLAAMTKWVSDTYTFTRRLDEIRRLESQGISPENASRIVERTMSKGIFSGVNTLLPVVLLAVGAFIVFKKG